MATVLPFDAAGIHLDPAQGLAHYTVGQPADQS